MTSMIGRSALAALACTFAVAVATPSMAEMVNMKAALSAKSEVPPNDSTASGNVTVTYDTASKKLTWKGTYTGLSGAATAAHFHSGEAGKNGGVAVPIAPATSPLDGSATLTDAQAADLMAGKLYVNIHTAKNPGGELRGQVVK